MHLKLCKIYGTVNICFSISDSAPSDDELYANMYSYQCDCDKPDSPMPMLFDTSTNSFFRIEQIELDRDANNAISTFSTKMDNIGRRHLYNSMLTVSNSDPEEQIALYKTELSEELMKIMEGYAC